MKTTTKFTSAGVVLAALAVSQVSALADSAADIETYPLNTAATYDDNGTGNYPIITTILSQPGTLDGYTYANYSYLVADTTGSLDIFYSHTLAGPASSYPTPTVGDSLYITGNYSPFDGIPEIANSTANPLTITGPISSGNTPYNPTPALTTIPAVNVGTNAYGINSSGFAGTLVQLDNVTISGAGTTWAYHANTTATVSDGSGNSMTLFLWASSYSSCGLIATDNGADPTGGALVPTGLVDMTGFVDDFGNSAEFVPTSIEAVSAPEPSSIALAVTGGVGLLLGLRRRK